MNNGGEFANDEMQELSNQYGICIKQAVAYSPWRMDWTNVTMPSLILWWKLFEDFPNADENTALSLLHLLGIVAFMFVDSHLLD